MCCEREKTVNSEAQSKALCGWLTNFVVDSTLRLTVFNFLESISIAQAAAINELRACIAVAVVVPHRVVAGARAVNLWKVADVFAGRLDASVFAVVLRLEAILVSTASAIPEATAAAVLGVEEVLDLVVVAAVAHVSLEAASLLRRVGDLVFTAFKVGAFSLGGTVRTAAVLTGRARAAFEVGSFGWCCVV